jgi:hypothetical protein
MCSDLTVNARPFRTDLSRGAAAPVHPHSLRVTTSALHWIAASHA